MPKGKDVIGFAKDKQAVMVDLKFMDFLGLWQHFTIPIAELSEAIFDEGLGFDGSSIRGWAPIHASDMLVVPDPDTATMDPYLKQSGIGDVAYFGPEAEFFIFDGVSYDTGPNHGHYRIESREGQWETGNA